MSEYHVPVLLHESVDGLVEDENGVYVDATFGGGGHSREILNRLGENGKLIAFDQDEDARQNVIDDSRFQFVNQNFRYLKNFLRMHKSTPVDGILADLGVSSHQFDTPGRGFSFRYDADLDMRMGNTGASAARVLNEYAENDLKHIFRFYGEVERPGRLVAEVIRFRAGSAFQKTGDLVAVAEKVFPAHKVKNELPKIFQALRIEVNKELEALEEFLHQSIEVLKERGRLVVISYHSLEDRLVKNMIKAGNFNGEQQKDFYGNLLRPLKPLTRKAVMPSEEEIERNPRSRSAKLRIAEKL